jgi:hypothetical protein
VAFSEAGDVADRNFLKTDLSRVEMDFIGEILSNSLAEGIARRLALICCDSGADSLNHELDAAESQPGHQGLPPLTRS